MLRATNVHGAWGARPFVGTEPLTEYHDYQRNSPELAIMTILDGMHDEVSSYIDDLTIHTTTFERHLVALVILRRILYRVPYFTLYGYGNAET